MLDSCDLDKSQEDSKSSRRRAGKRASKGLYIVIHSYHSVGHAYLKILLVFVVASIGASRSLSILRFREEKRSILVRYMSPKRGEVKEADYCRLDTIPPFIPKMC